ncbi:MAG: hypothetical protein K9G76_00220 [Bacteroidales bacterium]|nr:hypothetical protein [Bacteroidales bacterium]MCF8402536.1 hypothetical protein [Bacteroidales bacterium]
MKKYYRGNEKSKKQILFELLGWLYREGTHNANYFAFGLDQKGSSIQSYIGKKEFLKIKDLADSSLKKRIGVSGLNYDIITKDKFYASSILLSNEVSSIENLALISNGQLIYKKGSTALLNNLFEMDLPVFIKNTVLEYNEGLIKLEKKKNDFLVNGKIANKEDIEQRLSSGFWVIQKIYKSSKEIQQVNSTALNTTRVYTIMRNGMPEFLGGFQSFATGCECTDSWGKGSIYVGFDSESEKLSEYGFYHPNVNKDSKVSSHPDSKIIFKGYKIPGLRAAVEICKNAHLYFYTHFIIGWDIAITDDGPVVVEVNEKPGINAIQVISGGLRLKLLDFYKQILN